MIEMRLGPANGPGRVIGTALLLAAVLISWLSVPAISALEYQDHLSLVEALGEEAANEIVDELSFPAGATVHLVPEQPHPANWLMERIIAAALRERGYQVIQSAYGYGLDEGPTVQTERFPEEEGPGTGAVEPPAIGEDEEQGELVPADAEEGEEDSGEGAFGSGADEDEEDSSGQDMDGQDEGPGETGLGEQQPEEAEEPDGQQPGPRRGGVGQQEAPPSGEPPVAPAPAPAAEHFEMRLPSSGEVLTFRVVDFGVSYPWTKRSWLVGPRRYGRIASVRMRAMRLMEPAHEVLGVAESDRIEVDEFPGWARPYVEGQGYPFRIPEPEKKSLKRFAEPVLVAAIVTGLVYLFYENQK